MEMIRSTVEKICCQTSEEEEELSKDHSCHERRVCKGAGGSLRSCAEDVCQHSNSTPAHSPDPAGPGDSSSSILGTVPLWQEGPVQYTAHSSDALYFK